MASMVKCSLDSDRVVFLFIDSDRDYSSNVASIGRFPDFQEKCHRRIYDFIEVPLIFINGISEILQDYQLLVDVGFSFIPP